MAITSWAPHPFSLRQIQYVVAVAESLSFRRAADRCRVSQPSLSAQVAQVEEALGVRLFERDRRRVLVTNAGRLVAQRGRRLLLEASDLVDATRRAADPLAGTLRVGVIPTVSPYLLPRIAPAVRKAHPSLSLRWVEEKTPTLVAALKEGTVDAALLALEAEIGDVARETICDDPFVLATPADHPLSESRRPASLDALRDAPVLLLEEGHCFRDQALAVCTHARARELEYRATSLSTLAQMVAGGAGVTLLPQMSVETETRRAGLTVRRFVRPVPHRTIGLVWRKRSPVDAGLRALAATIRRAA